MKSFLCCATALLLSLSSYSQIVGGRDNGEMSPKAVESSTINSGTIVSDVNLLTGEFTSSVPLGAVTTPGGVSFSLSLEYASNANIGTTATILSGIPYGEGWNLSIPTISVEADAFHKYLLAEEERQQSTQCGAAGSPDRLAMNFDGPAVSSDPVHQFTGLDQGDAYWFAPQISIPGIVSGRMIFKYIDESVSPSQLVFGMHGFESPVEIRMTNSTSDTKWTVTLADGTVYLFDVVQNSYSSPINTRVLSYDYCSPSTNNAASAINSLAYSSNAVENAVLNSILPKLSSAIWYCSKISNNNVENQVVELTYDMYGKFNFYKEFFPSTLGTGTQSNSVNAKIKSDFSTYRDVVLKAVTSKVNGYPFEIMELDYRNMSEIYANYPNLVNPAAANSGVHDNMYSWQRIQKWGSGVAGTSSFANWSRYQHVKAADFNIADVESEPVAYPTNPYIRSNGRYRRTTNASNSNQSNMEFEDGFLESGRLKPSQAVKATIPGDIYEIKTSIYNSRGTIDIAVVTGEMGNRPNTATGSEETYDQNNAQTSHGYSEISYEKTRGIKLFSTFNSAFKWWNPLSGAPYNIVSTSNLFVMPNVPKAYDGFNIQVGPGNSDVDYSTSARDIWQYLNNPPHPQQSMRGREAYGCMPASMVLGTTNATSFLFKSGSSVPSNFGNGYPWGMMVPFYKSMDPNAVTSDLSMYQCWYMDSYTVGQNSNSLSKHRPTTMGYQDPDRSIKTSLESLELIRYSKNPYMLRAVSVYRVNDGTITTGKRLIAQKQLNYTHQSKDLIENYDYYASYASGSVQIKKDSGRKRVTLLLSQVFELPLNATPLISNFGLTTEAAAACLSTKFDYSATEITSTVSSLYEVRGDFIYPLSSVIDLLGGVTTVVYKSLTNTNFSSNYNPERFSSVAVINNYSTYGDGKLYNVSITVDKVQKQDNGSLQEWTYLFSNPMKKHNQYLLHTDHFRNAFAQSVTRGFKNVTVREPANNGVTLYTTVEHYGALTSDYPTTSVPNGGTTFNSDLENLCFGKIRSSKTYMESSPSDILISESTNAYGLTLAFENGILRPNIKRSHKTYNEDMTSAYLYEDYYLNQVTNTNKSDFVSYYSSYNPTTVLGEKPKMMEAYFYSDLLAANQNRAWLFNSYFVKLVSNSTKQYEYSETRMANAAPIQMCMDINGNTYPCPGPVVVVQPSSCNNALVETRSAIETNTEYSYYEADYRGTAQGTAYHNLLGIDAANPKTISFVLYGMGRGSRSQGNLKLKHEPSWQLAAVTTSSPQLDGATKKEEFFYFYDLKNRYDRHWYYYDIDNNPGFQLQLFNGDTIAVNYIVNNVRRLNAYSLPRYEGMESARVHNNRSIAFQKTRSSKNSSDIQPVQISEYYHFDNSWTYQGNQTYKPVFLRSAAIQIDSSYSTNGTYDFLAGRIDRGNKYIADFKAVIATAQPFNKNYIYSMLSPFDQLVTRKITERNVLLMPITMENQMGLKTRYNINIATSGGNLNNLGLVESIVIGYSRADAMTSSFQYNPQGLIKKMTEPSGRYLDYTYDDYLRLKETTENGTNLLSKVEYSYWVKSSTAPANTVVSFNARTNQNNIVTTIYNSSEADDKETLKAFTDPLGRSHSTLQAYLDLNNTLLKIYSPTVVYDKLNRPVRSYKAYSESTPGLDASSNTGTAFSAIQYDNTVSRPVKSADFGEDITSSTAHLVNQSYKIVNGVVAYCELGLNNDEAKVMMRSTGQGGNFRFFRHIVTDQDGKQTATYTNAFGQLAAKSTFSSAGVRAVTIFGYDSYGNVNRVINPNDQITTYLYNILGQLIIETSPDAGTKKYMYNKLGQVSAMQDQNERVRIINGSVAPSRYRVFKYDDYGRPTIVALMDVPTINGQQVDALYYESVKTQSFKYIFSNASSYDWLCNFSIRNSVGDLQDVFVTPSFFETQLLEKTYAYGLTPSQNTIGKLIQDNSYNNYGTKILKNVFTYDPAGNLASQVATFSPVNAEGNVDLTVSKINYTKYNFRKSLLEEKIDVNNDNITDLHLFYKYDRLNRLQGISAALGEVAASTDATLLVSYFYDIEGKMTRKEHRIDQSPALNRLAMEIGYDYDVRNRLTQTEAKNAAVSVMKYNLYYDQLQPASVNSHANWNGNINGTLTTYNFNSADNVVYGFDGSTTYGYQYDAMNRLITADAGIADFISQNAVQGALIGDEETTYDKSGNILSLKRNIRGQAANFTETEWWNYSYLAGTNKLSGVTGQNTYSGNRSYTYDGNGNMLTDNYRTITATIYGREAYAFRLNKGTDIIDYLYDVKDQRVYKKTDAVDNAQDKTEYYLQDAAGRTVAICKVQQGLTSWEYYISGSQREMSVTPLAAQAPGSNAANTDKRITFGQTDAFLYDHLGSTRVIYTAASWDEATTRVKFTVKNVIDYAPYGKVIREFTASEPAKFFTTQHERDAETGLDYRGARYYDSDLGRFLSVDPLSINFPGWSTYNYVMGNPIVFIDPTGRSPEISAQTKDPRQDEYEINRGENKGGWTKNHLMMNEAFGDPNGFNSLIGNKSSQNDNSTGVERNGEVNASPNDGSSPNPKDPARIYFKNVPKNVLDGIRVIPENAGSNKDLKNAKNGQWYEADGLWIKGQSEWFKIPNINTVVITYDFDNQKIKFDIETNIWGSILWYWKMTTPAFVPDSGSTTHITDYPFKD